MNRLLLLHCLDLSSSEGVLQRGAAVAAGSGFHRRLTWFAVRLGVLFELEPLTPSSLLRGGVRDVGVNALNGRVEIRRFLGIQPDVCQGRMVLRFADRFNLADIQVIPLSAFRLHRFFAITRVAPAPGFHFLEFSPLAGGTEYVKGPTRPEVFPAAKNVIPNLRPFSGFTVQQSGPGGKIGVRQDDAPPN